MRAGERRSFDSKTCRSRASDRQCVSQSSAARQPAQKPRSTLARRREVIPTVACPIAIALSSRAAAETVVVPRVTAVITALATVVLPRLGRSARNPSGYGKADHDNDNPLHVWPTASPYVHQETHTKKPPEPGQVPHGSGASLSRARSAKDQSFKVQRHHRNR
jgi:hypothetical protein